MSRFKLKSLLSIYSKGDSHLFARSALRCSRTMSPGHSFALLPPVSRMLLTLEAEGVTFRVLMLLYF